MPQGLSQGARTLTVPLRLFALNRERLCKALKEAETKSDFVVLLQGGSEETLYSGDCNDLAFRQEPYFHWLFGVAEPDFYGAVHVGSGKSVLFMPRFPESYVVVSGEIFGPDHFKEIYGVDEVHYVDEMPEKLQNGAFRASRLLLLKGQNTDSGLWTEPAKFEGIESRVFKTMLEVEVLQYVAKQSAEAHKAIMKGCKPGMYEYQLESGRNGAVLHYGHAGAPNNKQMKDGDLCVVDMGAEYFRYAADITCTFPVNGRFTENQKFIYNAVLKANLAVQNSAKAGVAWPDMHKLAEWTILNELKNGGLLEGDVNEMMSVRLGAVFMPHGLGHFLGLDVHDVGGYPKGVERIDQPGLRKLRTARILQAGMYITIEPGCYFINPLLDSALTNTEQAKFLVRKKIEEFRGFGGVNVGFFLFFKPGVRSSSFRFLNLNSDSNFRFRFKNLKFGLSSFFSIF